MTSFGSTGPSVTVNDCVVRGKTQAASAKYPRAVDVFYGIPYAKADRFRPAVAQDPTPSTTFNAKTPAPSLPYAFAPHQTRENPLTLNVVRPSRPTSNTTDDGAGPLLPVVIYVHGGAFNFSHPLERDIPAFVSWAAAGNHEVLVVSIAYRLGVLGFLAGWDEGGDGAEEVNLGLRDQKVAVEWVRRWVGAFGGDAEDITMMGVSAGAHSIGHHLIHPTPPPFRKAILESGSPTARSILSADHPRPLSQFKALKCLSGNAPLATMPVDDILEAGMHVFASSSTSVCWPFQAVVDGPGGVIPDTPLQQWEHTVRDKPRAQRLAVITGFSSHEGTSFVPQKASTNSEFRSFFATLIPGLSPADLDALDALYPDPVANPSSPYRQPPFAHTGAQFRRLHEAYSHYAYICPILHTAHTLSLAGARVYLYEFAALAEPFHSASHGSHANIVNHDMDALRSSPGLLAVAGEMNRRWATFAATPDGHLSEDEWPSFKSPFVEGGDGKLLVFGQGNDEASNRGSAKGTPVQTRTLTQSEKDQCHFWWDRMYLSQGAGESVSKTL